MQLWIPEMQLWNPEAKVWILCFFIWILCFFVLVREVSSDVYFCFIQAPGVQPGGLAVFD